MVILRGVRIFLALFTAVVLVLVGGGSLIYHIEKDNFLERLKITEANSLELQRVAIERILDRVVADVLFLAEQNELIMHLDTGDRRAVMDMEREYLHLAASRRDYDQIRFLNEQGVEQVRINYRNGLGEVVPESRLQDKSGRYYFEETFALNEGNIFLSPMDLNVEHGLIEQPARPMLRIGTPVFDTYRRKRGIVLINYNAQDLLDTILWTGTTAEGLSLLLNCQGYWLLGPTPDDEWGFMYPGRKDVSFANSFPAEWHSFKAGEQGQLLTENGLFTFAKLHPLAHMQKFSIKLNALAVASAGAGVSAPYVWTLASRVHPDVLNGPANRLKLKLLGFGGALFIIMNFGAWTLAMAVARRRIYQDQLVEAALFDALTGLPNRKLFFDRLDSAMVSAERYERRLALVYIDLDGFKAVNDTKGHDAGDELLKRVSAILTGSVRKSDTVSRLGGDEFAVILSQVGSVQDAALVGEKIVSELRAPIALKSGPVTIGASVGVAVFPEHGHSEEDLIKKADQAMYISKNKGKNTCTLADSSRCADD
ncbi:sensor domain-containing diguanylate cyclase [Desulfovibrio sp. Fe33]|uniref:sensor domain-containing diguanylate cyclase n=1 Tax=Desulfovibrio sp. Fe33 TaxID=3020842 RepID=UPI00234C9838|nr:sensor domain-containing diguanylate cyclase [Desulfovibrio sp. Fe33]